ncbi:MAG: hypothetical protein ABH952_06335 [Candidatus Omnitrophota bacterium]
MSVAGPDLKPTVAKNVTGGLLEGIQSFLERLYREVLSILKEHRTTGCISRRSFLFLLAAGIGIVPHVATELADKKKLLEFLDRARSKIETAIPKVPPELIANPTNPHKISNLTEFKIVSDSNSMMEAAIFQVGDEMGAIMAGRLAEVLRDDVKLIVVTNSELSASLTLGGLRRKNIKNLEQRLRFIIMKGGFSSSWARDPYIVLVNQKTKQYSVVPIKGDAGTGLDRSVGMQIMNTDAWDAIVDNNFSDKTLDMQGGDVTADGSYVYVGKQTVHYSCYNIASQKVLTEEEAIRKIEAVTGRQVIVLDCPDIHNDRYHVPIGKTKYGEHTSLLADPIKALEIIAALTPEEKEIVIENIASSSFINITREQLRGFLDVTPEEIEKAKQSEYVQELERVRESLEAEGITVRRVPALPIDFADNPFGLYYTNVVMDCYPDTGNGKIKRSIIIPQYEIPQLDQFVAQIYRDLGFEQIFPIESIVAGCLKGGPRCLLQAMGRPIEKNSLSRTILSHILHGVLSLTERLGSMQVNKLEGVEQAI